MERYLQCIHLKICFVVVKHMEILISSFRLMLLCWVNRVSTIDIISLKANYGSAVCLRLGFKSYDELKDGHELQGKLINMAGKMPILGPNCYGIINYFDNFCFWPDQHGGQKVDSGVAVITKLKYNDQLTIPKRVCP